MADKPRRPLSYESAPPRDVGENLRLYLGLALAVASFSAAGLIVGLAVFHWLRG